MSHDSSAALPGVPEGLKGVTADWSADKQAFPVPWGKAMMWIFLLSDTFIFSCFLISYMNVRISTTAQWPNPSEVFSLTVFGTPVPLFLIAFLFFGSLMLGTGSLGSNMREAQQLAMVWSLTAALPMMMMAVLLREPHGIVARVMTWLPFTNYITGTLQGQYTLRRE